MSTTRTDYNALQEIFVGTTKAFAPTIIDPNTGQAKDMTDTAIYSTVIFKIYTPEYVQIGTDITGTFIERSEGLIQYVVNDTITTSENAGNWIGDIEFYNIDEDLIDQQQVNFNILQSI